MLILNEKNHRYSTHANTHTYIFFIPHSSVIHPYLCFLTLRRPSLHPSPFVDCRQPISIQLPRPAPLSPSLLFSRLQSFFLHFLRSFDRPPLMLVLICCSCTDHDQNCRSLIRRPNHASASPNLPAPLIRFCSPLFPSLAHCVQQVSIDLFEHVQDRKSVV